VIDKNGCFFTNIISIKLLESEIFGKFSENLIFREDSNVVILYVLDIIRKVYD
jgi:hypothetical protein